MEFIATFLPPKRPIMVTPKKTKTALPVLSVKPLYGTTKFQQFSVPFSVVLKNYSRAIPPVMKQAMTYITEHSNSYTEEYLFKQTTPQPRLLILREQANRGYKPHFRDAHEAAALIKLFLREMTDPVIPTSQYENILNFPHNAKEAVKVHIAINIIEKMPVEHKSFLWNLFTLLSHISEHKEINKMGSKELGLMIGPNICWPEDVGSIKASHMITLGAFARFLIDHAATFFKYDPARVPDGAWHSTIVNPTNADVESAMAEAYSNHVLNELLPGETVYYNVLLHGKPLFVTQGRKMPII